MDIRLSPTGDLPDSLSYITGIEAVGQRIGQRLRTNRGEWLLDTDTGIRMFEISQTKEPDPVVIGVGIRKEIEDTPGVRRITEWTVAPFDRANRKLGYVARIEADSGETLVLRIGVPVDGLANGSMWNLVFGQGRVA